MNSKLTTKSRPWGVAVTLLFVTLAVSIMLLGRTSSAADKLATLELECAGSTPEGTSISLKVTAGQTGAPAGFSVQWMTQADFVVNGWPVDSDNPGIDSSFCKASFSGVPGCSQYGLVGAGASVTVKIGDNLFDECGASSTCANQPLECNTEYVFRAFAHNVPGRGGLNRSDYSLTQTCKTATCPGPDGGCTLTQGYWKTHGPIPTGNNTNEWHVTSLTLGTVSYTDLQLQSIFDTPAGGNGLIALAHQLIAAKLNIANGANPDDVAIAIAAADALIGGLVIPPVGAGSLAPSATSALTETLTQFNEGLIGPGHCQ